MADDAEHRVNGQEPEVSANLAGATLDALHYSTLRLGDENQGVDCAK